MRHSNPTQARSATGHVLLPAFNADADAVPVPLLTSRNLVAWSFGRGTVIWRIWPAVLLHTVFAAIVVSVSLKTSVRLGIPNVMLTLLGVVIGFVISYRASSGYDRYWQGRSTWSDLARTARTFGRLVWIHVPLKLANDPGTAAELDASVARRVMAEKRTALGMIEGFVVAVKHHLRGEMGIYYEDLYPLVKPLHNHPHHQKRKPSLTRAPAEEPHITVSSPHDLRPLSLAPAPPAASSSQPPAHSHSPPQPHAFLTSDPDPGHNPVIPPINAYGTFNPPSLHIPPPSIFPSANSIVARPALPAARPSSSSASLSSASSDQADRRPLLPGAVPAGAGRRGLCGSVAADLVPFGTFWRSVGFVLGWRRRARVRVRMGAGQGEGAGEGEGEGRWVDVEEEEEAGPPRHPGENGAPAPASESDSQSHTTLVDTSERLGLTHAKHRPRLAGGGENLPLEILRALSVWVSVLDERGVVPGAALGGMYGCLAAFEDSLCTLERILTTPLPFVYSVHIRHTVWVYLFFLPFQLVDLFAWYAIPGVGIAAFIYLGLIAAGEEIEQPFGASSLSFPSSPCSPVLTPSSLCPLAGYDEVRFFQFLSSMAYAESASMIRVLTGDRPQNDLDLDFFCRAVVHADIERLKRVVCPNVYLGAHHRSDPDPSPGSGGPQMQIPRAHDFAVDPRTRAEAVFGGRRHAE
ncbi:hypothetical protein BV20DRAFT_789411 [Pilatotrama ljubarskyi]|nr:hypothetical protein BV20DRAFT_789411 [Pilatotrama ljubarskyi]